MNYDPRQLIVRFLANEASSEEQEALFEWINQDPKNHKIFEHYYALWNKNGNTLPIFHPQRKLQLLNARIDALEDAAHSRTSFPWWKLAAAAVLVIATSAGFWMKFQANQSPAVAYNVVTGSPHHITLVKLPDGSEVKLNASSTLRYPEKFNDQEREVFLSGEAFFSVSKDPKHPFIVRTSDMRTEVLGTSFNVKEGIDNSIVAVATGKVKVSGAQHYTVLVPHQKVVYNRQSGQMKVLTTPNLAELAWMENTITFEDTDLLSAAKVLEARYEVKIQFDNQAIQTCRITGKFRNESLDHILEAISFSTGIKFKITNKTIQLSGTGC